MQKLNKINRKEDQNPLGGCSNKTKQNVTYLKTSEKPERVIISHISLKCQIVKNTNSFFLFLPETNAIHPITMSMSHSEKLSL